MDDLKSSNIQFLISSPKNRAIDTALELFGNRMKILIWPEFASHRIGEICNSSTINTNYGLKVDSTRMDNQRFPERVVEIMSKISRERSPGFGPLEVAIVTHSSVLKQLIPGMNSCFPAFDSSLTTLKAILILADCLGHLVYSMEIELYH